jgi:8-oxo-dGTP diphosphatase
MENQTVEIPSIAFEVGGDIRFVGAKVAVFVSGEIICLLRDIDRPIPWPGHWDVLGGGREGDESPWDCVRREASEESGLELRQSDVKWAQQYMNSRGANVWFFVAEISEERGAVAALQNEGQAIGRMTPDAYLWHDMAVPQFQQRLADWIAGI